MEYCGGGSLQDIYHGTVNLTVLFWGGQGILTACGNSQAREQIQVIAATYTTAVAMPDP